MSNRKPQPLISTHHRKLCPVCGHTSYSAAGIHPQCSVRQADARQHQKLQSARKPPVVKKPAPAKREQRICPRCKVLQHLRKTCTCGYVFEVNFSAVSKAGRGD